MENKIWFTSDTHFGHKNVIKYCNRPFNNVEEMDEILIKNWNSVVSPGDFIYHLGDVSFAREDRTSSVLSRLNGQIGLVKGNHDKNVTNGKFSKHFSWIKDLYELWVPDADAQGGRRKIVMCHYPMLTWNKSHHGSWQLHGHCHGSLPDDPNSLRIDVGVDCHEYRPISYDEIKRLMKKKVFKPVDHHGRAD